VELEELGENKGIAYALNKCFEKAVSGGYAWNITLDQDSVCEPELVSNLAIHAKSDVAIVSPSIIYRNNEGYAARGMNGVDEVKWVITSASLTNVRAWQAVHSFDEWMFIDGVDIDFCIRTAKAGYRLCG
jgi:rhamnosyltransferase